MDEQVSKNKIDDNEIDKNNEIQGKIVRHSYSSNLLNNKRFIDIYLPPRYDKKTDEYYPVLYMHDGNNLFESPKPSGDVDWEVDLTIEKLLKRSQIEKIIVVGIHNTEDRDYEYNWVKSDNEDSTDGGGGAKYAEFIVNELKPFIDDNYRTLSNRENTAVIGSSFGGLISLYLGIHYSHIFSKIGAMSPSLWWADKIIMEDIKKLPLDLKVWLDMGTAEDMNQDDLTKLKDILVEKGYIEGENLAYLLDKGAEHNESDWAKRFSLPLLFFFSKN